MFEVEVNEVAATFVVKHTDIDNCSTVIANGKFSIDSGHRSMLVLVTHLTIPLTDTSLIGKFILDVTCYMGKYYKVRVFLHLPMFDGRLDMNNLKLEHRPTNAMTVRIADVCYDDSDTLLDDREKYELITDKQAILQYSQQLAEMLRANAYWVGDLNRKDIDDRVQSSKRVAMVLDKANDVPCGFGRLFMMTKNCETNDAMGYVDDIVVESGHQNRRLGSAINNYLMGIKQEGMNGTLCLMCTNEGAAAISAGKLYKKAGFEPVSNVHNRIALFVNEEHVAHH